MNKLGDIDYNRKPLKADIFLCKPDKKTIEKISEACDLSYSTKLGTINEITFKIPTILEKDRVPITNPNIELIKHKYLFKLLFNNQTEYFIFDESNKNYSDDEYVEYQAFSLGYKLAYRNVRSWEAVSKNLSTMIGEIIQFTNWKLGYVDSEFDLKFRSHEIASQTVLQSIIEIAEKFNALIKWDTVNMTINFYLPQNVGLDRGLRLKYGKYLESFNLSSTSEELTTRLKIYGKDSLTIRRLSPTGQVYLEDFSWYMYPFERDANGNIIKESDYMSNELCIALEDYKALLNLLKGQFDTLTTNLKAQQDITQQLTQELSVLNTELTVIWDSIDVSNAAGLQSLPPHQVLINNKDSKVAEVQAKNAQIVASKANETSIQSQIDTLRVQVLIENNLTPDQLLELDDYIHEHEYSNDSIVDEEDLLLDGVEAFVKFREPKINLTIDMVQFLSMIEHQNNWEKLNLGDTIRIIHERLSVDIKAKIIEINYNFESDDISLTIANEKEINDDLASFLSKLNDAGNTSTVVNMDKYKWNLALENNGAINDIINNKWNALKNAVQAGYQQNIEISERGIIVRDLSKPDTWLVIQNGHLAITNDGGNTWKHSITSEGIVGERIYGKIISGVNLAIEDESGIWITRGSRTTIYDRNGTEVMRLGLVTDAPDPECFGVKLENKENRVQMTSCNGFRIDKWENNQWVMKFTADLNGHLYAEDMETKRLVVKGSAGEVFIDAHIGLIDFSQFKMIVGQLRAESIYSDVITAQDGFITDLVVNRLKTLDAAKISSGTFDYIHIEDNYMRFLEGTSNGSTSHAMDYNGNLMYWTDGGHTQRTLKNTGIPVMVQSLSDKEKMKIHFEDRDGEKVPVIEMSVGGSGSGNMGYIYKTTDDMVFEYFNSGSKQRRIRLRDEGIVMDTKDGVVVVNGGNFYVSATEKDSGWTKDTFQTDGGFFIPANANGVYNQFQDAARWKLDDDNYIFQNKDTFNIYMNKDIKASIRDGINGGYGLLVNGTVKASHLELTAGSATGGTSVIKPNAGGKIRIEADANNYIEVSNAGVKVMGTVINLN